MQYHTAHHAFPGVPFHQLPQLHRRIFTARGGEPPTMTYLAFQWAVLHALAKGKTEADYSSEILNGSRQKPHGPAGRWRHRDRRSACEITARPAEIVIRMARLSGRTNVPEGAEPVQHPGDPHIVRSRRLELRNRNASHVDRRLALQVGANAIPGCRIHRVFSGPDKSAGQAAGSLKWSSPSQPVKKQLQPAAGWSKRGPNTPQSPFPRITNCAYVPPVTETAAERNLVDFLPALPELARPSRVGGYKVGVNRGQRIGRVSSEWFSRPADERALWLCRSVSGTGLLTLALSSTAVAFAGSGERP